MPREITFRGTRFQFPDGMGDDKIQAVLAEHDRKRGSLGLSPTSPAAPPEALEHAPKFESPVPVLPTSQPSNIREWAGDLPRKFAEKGAGIVQGLTTMAAHPVKTFEALDEANIPKELWNYAKRYSPSRISQTLYEDPVGMGMDLASILIPASAAVGAASKAPAAAKLAQGMQTAAKVADPIGQVALPAVARAAGKVAMAPVRVGQALNPTQPDRFLHPFRLYKGALQPSSTRSPGPQRLDELREKAEIGFRRRYIPGDRTSYEKALADNAAANARRQALIDAHLDDRVPIEDIANQALADAQSTLPMESGMWDLDAAGNRIPGPLQAPMQEQHRFLLANPAIKKQVQAVVPQNVPIEMGREPARLGPPRIEPMPAPISGPRALLPEPPLPAPPPSGPRRMTFDPAAPGSGMADIPTVPEPIQRSLTESTRDMQTRGVLRTTGAAKQSAGLRPPETFTPPALTPEQSLAASGMRTARDIIPETPTGTIIRSGDDVHSALRDALAARNDPGFSRLPTDQQNAIQSQVDQLQSQIQPPKITSYMGVEDADLQRRQLGHEVREAFYKPHHLQGRSIITKESQYARLAQELEKMVPGLDAANLDVSEMSKIMPDLSQHMETTEFVVREGVPVTGAYALARGATGSPSTAVAAGTSAGTRSILHHPDWRAKLAFFIWDAQRGAGAGAAGQLGRGAQRISRTAQQLQSAMAAAPRDEIALIAGQLGRAVGAKEEQEAQERYRQQWGSGIPELPRIPALPQR